MTEDLQNQATAVSKAPLQGNQSHAAPLKCSVFFTNYSFATACGKSETWKIQEVASEAKEDENELMDRSFVYHRKRAQEHESELRSS